MLHHVELWVPDLDAAITSWGWLFGELGWSLFQEWPAGRSWRSGETYVVLEQSPALSGRTHDRFAPGLNHLAFHAGARPVVDRLVERAPEYGWSPLFAGGFPVASERSDAAGNSAGGPDSYAGYLEDGQGYEVELVAG